MEILLQILVLFAEIVFVYISMSFEVQNGSIKKGGGLHFDPRRQSLAQVNSAPQA